MTIWAIVPVKALHESKSRLRDVLTPEQRVELSRKMLLNTLQVLAEIPEIERTLVVSADSTVLALAQEYGAEAVEELGSPSLNKALRQATSLAGEMQVEAVLVLPADLPLIQTADVKALIEVAQAWSSTVADDTQGLVDRAQVSPTVGENDARGLVDSPQSPPIIVIAPDRRRSGTNALLVSPPGTIKYGFGSDSFERHIRRAETSGARIEIIELPALGLDLDAPEDLQIYQDRFALIKE